MESLSRPFHSRKLSNASSFSTKNTYDGVFSGHRRKYAGASSIDVQDYREIFGSSQTTSSIPVLDLSTLRDPSDVLSLNLKSSKPDYSSIFGGFRDEGVAVSYQELFAPDKARTPSSTPPASQDSDNLFHQSSDALKQFSMSYNKISQKSNVTQLHAVAGFTHFIDERVPQSKKEIDKHKSSSVHVSVDSNKDSESVSEDMFFETFDTDPKTGHSTVSSPAASPPKVVNHKDYPKRSTTIDSESCKTDTLPTYFDEELDVNSAAFALKKAIEKAQESIRIAKESVGRKKKGLRSFSNKRFKDTGKVEGKLDEVTETTSSQAFPDFMDVKKIFVAKKVIDEINGKISGSTKQWSIPVTDNTKVETESRTRDSAGKDDNATLPSDAVNTETTKTETSDFVHENQTYNMFVDDNEGKIKATKATIGVLERQSVEEKLESVQIDMFRESESVEESDNLIVSKKLEDEKEGLNKECSILVQFNIFKDNIYVSNSTQVTGETESRRHDLARKDENAASCSDAVETETKNTETSSSVHEDQTCNMFVDDYEDKSKEINTTIDVLEQVDMFKESKENGDEVRLSNLHESVEESDNLNVSQKVVLEQEDIEIAEHVECGKGTEEGSEQDDIENAENVESNEGIEEGSGQDDIENAENVESDKGIDEGSEQIENENESKDDHNTELHKEEETGEIFCDDCELETKDRVQNCDNGIEESEVNLYVDCEIKKEDNNNHTVERKGECLDECCGQEFDENSSIDDNIMEETDGIDSIHVTSDIVDMNDNKMETTQVVDDVTKSFFEFQLEETESVKGEDSSEKEQELCNKTSVDQTPCDDNEDEYEMNSDEYEVRSDEYEVKSVENEVESESSSGTTHNVKIMEEENDMQSPHKEIPDIISTNEGKDSQEPGPSKASEKENSRKIDAETIAKERECEKNRLAVERAIREARERAFAEARERAERERAAVEKATQEVRQRMMADAHEKVVKASVGNKSSSEKASSQSKLRAERAAVERATSEARQRALEKAMSQKIVSELNRSESALRTKAKLEKHNRIMERAAKALAEKEKRDLLAQKEQAERNRLAEMLEADIKRWSNGKEGNLRALLSTLQYILGPESGWQPVTLTEIISTSAVKKAYRKATLCVHPDKLQQRGATIQQKYICEKVFDLLKAAWNRFNSEER